MELQKEAGQKKTEDQYAAYHYAAAKSQNLDTGHSENQ